MQEFSIDLPDCWLDEEITTLLLRVGIFPSSRGFHYLRAAIRLRVCDPALVGAMTTQLYPEIASRCETTPSTVERAIRHAIDAAWTQGRFVHLNEICHVDVFQKNYKPTNGELIALFADHLQLQARKRDSLHATPPCPQL